ncbi:MAG: hypothetical protein AAGL29_04755 [Bacteroidota bacterium]
MKKIVAFLVLQLSYGTCLFAQSLNCTDFHKGEFFIPTTEELKNFTVKKKDSIETYLIRLDSLVTRTVISRKGNSQTEWINEVGNGEPAYEIIQWIDECTYRLKYDESKMELNEDERMINHHNGIVVSKRKIEGNCLYYTATMTSNTGEEYSQNGTICKQ